jgi:NTE family protein
VRGGQLFELESEVDLLAFDMRPADLLEQVRQATKAARVAIRKRIFVDPEIYRDACETMRRSVIEAFQKEASLFETGQVGWIRVAVAIREPGSHQSLRLRFGAGFRRHADRELPLPIKGSVVGAAWKSGKPWLERVPFPPELSLPEERHSALRADVWSSLRWTLCVPILRDGQKEPAFVVTIDGASPLLKSPRVDTFALNLAEDVQDFFRDVVIRLDKQD